MWSENAPKQPATRQDTTTTHSNGRTITRESSTPPSALSGSSARLPLRGFEVPQQPVEGLLIHVMRLPVPKVPNVASIANQRGPARLQSHDRVVDPHWKEDGGALLAFPCQGGFDFLLDPLTRH